MSRRDLWKAPTENGGLLIDPPLDRAGELLEINRQRLGVSAIEFIGQPLSHLREQIQNSIAVVDDAVPAPAGRTRPKWPVGPLIVSGHQPELFHPGVWLKDFAAHGLACRCGAAPLHVIVDSDTIKSTSIQLPNLQSDPERIFCVTVPFDAWTGDEPLLGRRVCDESAFRGFVAASKPIVNQWPFRPILAEYWPEVLHAYDATVKRLAEKWWNEQSPPTIAWCLTWARQELERRWGCWNREQWLVGLNRHPFIAHIVNDLPRFHAVYNDTIRAYRRRYRLRSQSHPVPELARDGDFLEAPFWWYDAEVNRRHRLFVRIRDDRLDLRPGLDGNQRSVPRRPPFWSSELNQLGVQLTTRALTTTMFLRLCVADLFIHGIGGAKYDEVTDDIIRHYFGIEPPEYMVVSGTLRLPFKPFPAILDDRRRLARRLRDLDWNPERCVPGDLPQLPELMAEKRRWQEATPQDKLARWEVFRELRALNARIRALVPDDVAAEAQQELMDCEKELQANEILQRRDYAFVLHPEETLKPFCTQLLEN